MNQGLERRATVARLLADRGATLVVTGLGSSTYDVYAAGDHERNFYLWGAMGGAAVMGLGLALARPQEPVLVVTGDGEALMALGAFATIAGQAPRNLSVVVLDNAQYGETGAQASHTRHLDLAAVAQACGIAETMRVGDDSALARLAGRVHRIGDGPMVAVVRIAAGSAPRAIPVRDSAWVKGRFRLALGLAVDS
ncbi:MAG: thiamine pyrophosphate-dependent enzyme [Burkholderiaceae bacterium]